MSVTRGAGADTVFTCRSVALVVCCVSEACTDNNDLLYVCTACIECSVLQFERCYVIVRLKFL